MENIPLPSVVEVVPGATEHVAKIIIEPFFPGYGTTIGNALRRVLLSSLPGAALTSFSVKGIQHEFSNLPNIKEDFVEIALNLKLVRLKVHSPEPVRLKLKVKGERKVTAGDIETSSDVEIVNPEQHIATLTDDAANLEIELIARQGRGYQPTEAREKEELEVGMVALDALFSPVRKVGFLVESVRVGQMTNWDKLILEIETDGSIPPKAATEAAIAYLKDHLAAIMEKLQAPPQSTEVAQVSAPQPEMPAEATPDAGGASALAASSDTPVEPPKPKKRSKKAAAQE